MKLLWPVRNEQAITQHYNGQSLDYTPMVAHNGLDFAANLGEEIKAAYDGWMIERLTRETGFGKRVSLRHFADGRWWFTVYAHFQKFPDDNEFEWDWNKKTIWVKKGDIIGYADSTGFSTGNHLHFGLYPMNEDGTHFLKNNGYGGGTDPLSYLKGLPMVYFAHVEGTSEYGFVEESPYTKVYYRGTSENDIKFQAAKFGLNVTKADGSIDFTRAKDIKI